LKQHLVGRGSEVVHCNRVPPDVRGYFQCDLEKVTVAQAREKLRWDTTATEGNNLVPLMRGLNVMSNVEYQMASQMGVFPFLQRR
jgi:hypothetical protein